MSARPLQALPSRDIARIVLASTVYVSADGVFGSGFVIAPELVATNFHVISGTTTVLVCYGPHQTRCLSASFEKLDALNDLAILRVPGLGLQPLRFAPPGSARIGDKVYAAGNPEGLTGTFSDGLISQFRELNGTQLIQISAPISHGSSGGPVVDSQARVIGISKAIYEEGQNLNFAVSASHIRDLMGLPSTITRNRDSAPTPRGVARRSARTNNVFTNREAGVTFTVPAGWTAETVDEQIQLSSPDGGVTVLLWMQDTAFHVAYTTIGDQVDKQLQNVKTYGDGDTVKINGMDVFELTGTGSYEGTPVFWAIDLIKAKKPFIALSIGESDKLQKHMDAYKQLVNSIKKVP